MNRCVRFFSNSSYNLYIILLSVIADKGVYWLCTENKEHVAILHSSAIICLHKVSATKREGDENRKWEGWEGEEET